jgi:hypothetical protein
VTTINLAEFCGNGISKSSFADRLKHNCCNFTLEIKIFSEYAPLNDFATLLVG